ncbi:Putrescine importer PuuP (plasmid) [Rhodococcus opacus PD630]|nr:Putrescine importer PuuP [Rhodococcus opacus PD630]
MSVDDLSNTEHPPVAGAAAPQPTGSATTGLRGNLGVASLIATVIAFNGPLAMLAGFVPIVISTGNGLSAPLTYLVLGVVVLVFSVGLNAMASRMTHPGAFYTYITAGLGRPAGLAAGFLALLTYLALGAGTYALFAIMAEHLLTDTFAAAGPPWWVWALLAWAACTALSMFNIELSAKVLGVFMLCEMAIVLVWDACVLADGGPEGRSVDIFSDFFSGSFALAMVFGALCLTGFESLQVFRSETRDAARAVPRATYLSVTMLAGLYALGAFCYIISYGPSQAVAAGAEDPTGSVLSSIRIYVFSAAGDIANVLLLTSTFAACLAIQNISARYFFTLGGDGVLPARIGRANTKHGSPMIAAAIAGALMLLGFGIAALFGYSVVETFTVLTGLGGFWLIALWVGTSVAVVRFFHPRRTESTRAWQVLIAPVLAACALGAILVLSAIHLEEIVASATVANLSLVFLAVLLIGGMALGLWYRTNRPDTYRRIGKQAETADS